MEPSKPQPPPANDPRRRAFKIITPFQLMLFGGGAAILGGLLLAAVF